MRLLPALTLALTLIIAPQLARADVREITSQTGISAWLIEDHTLPLITVSLAFEGGSAIDPEGKEGLTSLLASLLDEGAEDLDSRGFQTALADRSIQLSFAADDDALYAHLKTLTRERDNAFTLLKMALRHPRFDVEPIGRMRDALIAQRQAAMSDPSAIAHESYMRLAYADHPYARPSDGTIESLNSITRDDLVAALPQHVVRNRMKISVVGDITPAQLATTLDQVFANMPVGADNITLPRLNMKNDGQITVTKRSQPQTMLLAGMNGIRRDDPDWFPALVMNYVLGGDFNSRLMEEIRVKRSLTYGIHSSLIPLKAGGMLLISASADNAKAADLLNQTRKELRLMAQKGVNDDELANAKTYLTGAFALRFNSSNGIADVLLEIQRLGLPISYLADRANLINTVTNQDVARVADRLLKTDQMAIAAVGQPDGIASTTPTPIVIAP